MAGGPGRHRPNNSLGGLFRRRQASMPIRAGSALRVPGIVMPGVTIGQTHISTLPAAVMRPESRRPETGLTRDTQITPMEP